MRQNVQAEGRDRF